MVEGSNKYHVQAVLALPLRTRVDVSTKSLAHTHRSDVLRQRPQREAARQDTGQWVRACRRRLQLPPPRQRACVGGARVGTCSDFQWGFSVEFQ